VKDREAEERRREQADQERRRREQQRKADEQRETELRQRLDELERRRKNDQRRLVEERLSESSSPSSPARAAPASAAPSTNKNDRTIDPLSGTDNTSHHATTTGSVYGGTHQQQQQQQTTASGGALRKKLGLPSSGAATPTTASAPSSARGPSGTSFPAVQPQQQQQQQSSVSPRPTSRGSPAALPPVSGTASGSSPRPAAAAPAKPAAAVVDPPASPLGSTTASMSATGGMSSSLASGFDGSMPTIDTTGRSHLDVYKAYCSALAIKPNSGLLKTLPSEPGKHCSTINLDLNYIGVRGVRPLIEILKLNRGLTLLNLKDNNLENAEVRQIVNVLMGEPGNTITHLDLSNNPISLAGGSAIMDLVARQPSLRTVVLRGTLIQAKVVEKITEAASRAR
jgi:hypothetical protein